MIEQYREYKETPALWIDRIPSSWESKMVKEIFLERRTKVSDKDYAALSVSKAGIVPQLETAVKTDNGDNRKLVKKGDFVVNSRSDRKGSSGISPYDGSVSLINIVLKPTSNENLGFLHYLLRSIPFTEEFYRNGRGLVSDLWTTRYSELKNIFLPIPPKDQQEKIVKILDWKTSQINHYVKDKKQEIQKLKELKISTINRAVSMGIRKDTVLQKNESSWLGDIPAHWGMLPSKRLFYLRKDKALPTDEQLTASQKYGVVPQQWFMEQEGRRVTVVFTGEDILKHVEKGDFVISMRSFQGGIEYSNFTGKISSAYVMLIPDHEYVYDGYFRWLLKSSAYIKALRATSDLVRDGQALRYANFAKIDLPVVPMDEQVEIADYLDRFCGDVDRAISNIRNEISLVQELKSRTIADVVTGKVDVRDVEIPEYETETSDIDDDVSEDEDSEEVETVDEEVDE